MNTIMIQGVIRPTTSSCDMERSCPSPCLERIKVTVNKQQLELDLQQKEASENPDFWKQRIMLHAASVHPIFSVTFIPHDLSKQTILFVQKRVAPLKGFVAPYLSEKKHAKWGAQPPSVTHQIQDRKSMQQSIQGVNSHIYGDIETCLEYFLQDGSTAAMGITYLEFSGKYVTHAWVKTRVN